MIAKKKGEKFTERYGTESATIYKGDVKALQIPGPDHALYDSTAPKTHDPIRVEAIDRDGKMTTPIEVWTDPDEGILWVVDGRGRLLDVREVNRRRAAEGRELVKPYIVPFAGDEKAAIARVREKNYHRRLPTPSDTALDLLTLRKTGHSWEACAKILHVETDNPEKWGRKLIPLAHCAPEVRAAFDAGELPRAAAVKFAGSDVDGECALGKREQLALLEKLRADKAKPAKRAKALTPKARERVRFAFAEGRLDALNKSDNIVAHVVAATMMLVNEGDLSALRTWSEVAKIIETALNPEGKPEKRSAPKLKAVS